MGWTSCLQTNSVYSRFDTVEKLKQAIKDSIESKEWADDVKKEVAAYFSDDTVTGYGCSYHVDSTCHNKDGGLITKVYVELPGEDMKWYEYEGFLEVLSDIISEDNPYGTSDEYYEDVWWADEGYDRLGARVSHNNIRDLCFDPYIEYKDMTKEELLQQIEIIKKQLAVLEARPNHG